MSKYDFGYQLEADSTNMWAYNEVNADSNILELGPAVGNLTYHLANFKSCKVDIIEIDKEAGKKAKQFASTALVGNTIGNLNKPYWGKLLSRKKYDYVIALDVLEHLSNPQSVLKEMARLLNEDGKILLSIPNIAHNAVLFELLQDRFEYTELGLLDKTHIHFFTYQSLMNMIKSVGLNVSKLDGIIKSISETEINVQGDDVPILVQEYLNERKYGEVYQFLVVLTKKKCKTVHKIDDEVSAVALYDMKALVNGMSKFTVTKHCQRSSLGMTVDLTNYEDVYCVRFFPTEHPAIISKLKAIDEKGNNVKFDWVEGVDIDEETVVVYDQHFGINFPIEMQEKLLKISCECKLIDNEIVDSFKRCIEKSRILS